jgi:serine/threonine protein phosphatase PrpC
MKIFFASYQDFIQFDAKPNEDAVLVSKKLPILAVADGVTQSHHKNGRYALPYGAKMAAQIFCKSSVKYLEKALAQKKLSPIQIKKIIKESFDSANAQIKALNEKHQINEKTMDYVQHDWFDTVGVVAVVVSGVLYYGVVGDCGLAVFNQSDKKILQTRDKVHPAVLRFQKKYPDFASFPKEKRAFLIHKEFRNNPDGQGYGSFTGEPSVQTYYVLGSKKLTKGDMVVLHSDGLVPLLKNKETIKKIREGNKKEFKKYVMGLAKENPETYGRDRTVARIII